MRKTLILTTLISGLAGGISYADSSIIDNGNSNIDVTTSGTGDNNLGSGTTGNSNVDNSLSLDSTNTTSTSDNSLSLDSTNTTSTSDNSLSLDSNPSTTEVLKYSIQNKKGELITPNNFTYSVDNYILIELKTGAMDELKNLDVNLNGKTDKTSYAYVCSSDQNIMGISFDTYKQAVNKITDVTKKNECKKSFLFAVTDAGIVSNTFNFNKGNKVITVETNNDNYTELPFSKIEIRNANNKLLKSFNIEKKVIDTTSNVGLISQPTNVQPPKKDTQNLATKKTGLGLNIILILLGILMLSAYNLKKRISE